jgi:hypothetical protein
MCLFVLYREDIEVLGIKASSWINHKDTYISRDSSASWTSGVRFSVGSGTFSLRHRVQIPIKRVSRVLSPGVKRPGCEADHSLPSRTEVKNASGCTSIPPYVFMARCFVKHRDNFTLPLLAY